MMPISGQYASAKSVMSIAYCFHALFVLHLIRITYPWTENFHWSGLDYCINYVR